MSGKLWGVGLGPGDPDGADVTGGIAGEALVAASLGTPAFDDRPDRATHREDTP